MDNASRMQMLDAAQHLIQQIRHSLVIQIHLNHLAQIRVHQFHHQVDVLEVLQRPLRRERVQQSDDLSGALREWNSMQIFRLENSSDAVSHVYLYTIFIVSRPCRKCKTLLDSEDFFKGENFKKWLCKKPKPSLNILKPSLTYLFNKKIRM